MDYIEALKWLWNEESDSWLDKVIIIVAVPILFIGFVICKVIPKLWKGDN